MSERKVLNKYYPPDFDPSKIPRARQGKNRQFMVRLMAPCNMRCTTCGEYIYKGKKFNAKKEDVENSDYLGIRIYRFYIKCTRCLAEISFRTDPVSTDYVLEAGATRNFMALKLAEEQAEREEQAEKEDDATNPMKMLEKRTQASRNEMNALEALEELKELNQRLVAPNFGNMLEKYDSFREQEEQRAKEEEEAFIRSALLEDKSEFVRRLEENDDSSDEEEPPSKTSMLTSSKATDILVQAAPAVSREVYKEQSVGLMKSNINSLVKRKVAIPAVSKVEDGGGSSMPASIAVKTDKAHTAASGAPKPNALSLLGGYDSDSDSS